ncbi:MAG: NAD(P)-binding protein [Dehalococcoidia bacterium]|nr:NAD(P)-binding protein [Dehalococcoidia bacterium]
MPIARTTEPITADDAALRAAIQDGAHLPSLLPALAHATGDLSLLPGDLRPTVSSPPLPQGGLSEEQQARATSIALDALRLLRDGAGEGARTMTEDDYRRMFQWMTSSDAVEEYLPLVLEELAPTEADPRAPSWRKDPDLPFTVVIVGAGMSGILAGIRLGQAGVPYVIIEKNDDVGGTWLENTYPGARVDVSNAFYSYSFAQRVDWPGHYSTQGVLLNYFRECAREYGVLDHIRFGTEVLAADWDEGRAIWSVRVCQPDRAEETLDAQALVSAAGQLNRPKVPDIAGLNSFEGPAFHSARWDHEVDLRDKRVAVIGTGASAAQFVPAIADDVAALTVFQRTPNWLGNVPQYHDAVPEGQRWLFRHVPHYAHWYRFWLFWGTTEGLLPAARVDEDWPDLERSVGPRNDALRGMMTTNLQRQLADRPDLLEKMLPTYPPASKRILLDNGSWARTMKRDHVRLVVEPIERVTPDGVVTTDGEAHDADVIIYGTGFQASRFLTPMRVTGRDGVDLHERWDGDARAYMGITVPGFPNFFMLYGPNTNIVVNGSIIYFSECEVHYLLGCLRLLLEGGHRSLECREDAHDAYNVMIDEGNRKMVWGVATVNSWYRNEKGRVAQNWPFSLLEYWAQTREPHPAAYELR